MDDVLVGKVNISESKENSFSKDFGTSTFKNKKLPNLGFMQAACYVIDLAVQYATDLITIQS